MDPDPHPPSLGSRGRRPYTATSGALLAAVPIPAAVASWSFGSVFALPLWATAVLTATTLALLAAGLSVTRTPRLGRLLGSSILLGLPALALPRLADSPGITLLLSSVLLVAAGGLWHLGAQLFFPAVRCSHPSAGRVRSSAAVAFSFWLVVALGSDRASAAVALAVGVSVGIAMVIGAWWLVGRRRSTNPRTRTVAAALLAALALAAATHQDLWSLVSSGTVYTLLVSVFGPRAEGAEAATSRWWTTLLEHPERMLVTTFATLAAVGAIILALPQSSSTGSSIGAIDAAFTAVSAVCVTGLIVRDTPLEFSALGQTTLLLLMQLGALGIMTFSTAALRMLGGRMTLRQESAVAHLLGTKDRSRLITSAQDVLRVTFVCEGLGATLLIGLFLAAGDTLATACWRGLFTAVSAFCNAGFALQNDSLVGYQSNPLVLHTVGLLIVLGGLSPAVVLAVTRNRERTRPLAIQARICILAAVALLVIGCAFFLVAEWNVTLRGLSLTDKLHNSWFQSVTLRTAGFNSVDIAAIHPATYVLMLAFMFIGASPGGTAGGVKTTTVAVLALSAVHTIRGSTDITVFGRRVPERTVLRAAVIVTVAVSTGALALLAILLTQDIPLPAAAFEVVSALGTVGLSQGATTQLDDVGRVIIAGCMFVGRIGGLSIMIFMSQRLSSGRVTLPAEDIDVG